MANYPQIPTKFQKIHQTTRRDFEDSGVLNRSSFSRKIQHPWLQIAPPISQGSKKWLIIHKFQPNSTPNNPTTGRVPVTKVISFKESFFS